ncbi:hypothetical protein P3S67_020309 [Capsicum chacoense]
MSSLVQSFKSKEALPMSMSMSQGGGGVRKRLSSLSLRMNMRTREQPILSSWAFRRSADNSIRKWWDWGLGWIMSKKLTFAKDLEMSEEEKAVLGCNSKGTWIHVFYKVRSELRRLVRQQCRSASNLPL